MTQQKAKDLETIERLRKEVEYHRNLYYEGYPEIEDLDFDSIYHELIRLEKLYPEKFLENSPTQTVGTTKRQLNTPAKHEIPMLSLLDVFNKEDVVSFIKKIKKEYPEAKFIVEFKIDGLSISLDYEDSELKIGSTRGNGLIGEDITLNTKELNNVPHVLKEKLKSLEVRGEAYMSYTSFIKTNQKQEDNCDKIFKNPRNCAAGTLRQLDPKVVKEREMDIIIFNLQKIEGKHFTTHSESLEWLRTQGFHVSPNYYLCENEIDVIEAIDDIEKKRNELDFGIDGAVIKVDSLSIRESMGNTSSVPKWAVAYKYKPEQKEVLIKDIIIQVGRTGRLTPVAVFDKVSLAGTDVSKATLHNQDQIDRLDIGIGDFVVVQKAGDIIPEICSVIKEKRTSTVKKFIIPNICPVCGSETYKGEEADIRCTNIDCSAQILKNIEFFASKDCMDIMGMGESIVTKLVQAGYIKHVSDIYYLEQQKEELIEKNIIGKEKTVNNLIVSINKSKENNIDRLIKALGSRNLGQHAGEIIAQKYKSIDHIFNAKYEDLIQLNGIGEVVASTIVSFFKKETTKKIVEELKAAGVNMNYIDSSVSNKLEGLTFVMTGTLPNLGRGEAKQLITSNGGKVSGSVSKKTNYLLLGENPGSSLSEAEALKTVTIISEKEFLELL